jgi:hypothetical protein
MKKLILTIIVLSLAAFSLTAQAKMTFKETTIDFGEVDSGETVDITFEFENTGKDVLTIKNISTSCGCTAATLEKKEYKPGEKGNIPVKFNSRGMEGKVSKYVTVTTNDQENIYARLQITGKVTMKNFAAVELTPDKIDFGTVNIGKEYSKKIEIKNTGSIELRIIEVTLSPEVVMAFPAKEVRPGDTMTVDITFKPMQEGHYTAFLKIRTNAYRQRLMITRLNAEIQK